MEIVGVHGAGVLPDHTPDRHYANRLKKGAELLYSGEADCLVLLGVPAYDGLGYVRKKFNVDEKRVLIEGRSRGTLQELKYFKKMFVDKADYKKIGLVSQGWHLDPRIRMLGDYFFPQGDYSVELIEAVDGRDEETVKSDMEREKLATRIDRARISLGRLGTSDAVQDLVELGDMLYSAKARRIDPVVDDVKSLLGSAYETVNDKRILRMLKWELAGAVIYGIPVFLRTYVLKDAFIPILNSFDYSPSRYIPSNMLDKVLVNSFFPGGAGGVAGETLWSKYRGQELGRRIKYLARLGGAVIQYAIWTVFQYHYYYKNIMASYGGNLFEPLEIMPFNMLMAALSVFTPDVVEYVSLKIEKYRRIGKNETAITPADN